MSGRVRVLGVLVVMIASLLLASGPAAAGGPTSVLLSVPGTGRMNVLHVGDADYDALASYVGAYSTAGPDGEPAHEDGAVVTLTWLIHDVQVWRVDRVHLGGAGGPWIATQGSAGDTSDIWSRPVVWHGAINPKELTALLGRLGVNPAGPPPAPATAAAAAAAGKVPAASAGEAPVAVTEVAAEPATRGWVWALVGLALGAVLTVTVEQVWARRRRPAAAGQPAPATAPATDVVTIP